MVHDMETASADSAVIWLHDSQNQGYGHSGVNGKKTGDEISVETQAGEMKYQILGIQRS